MIKGMDTSSWNGKGNWDVARANGVEFAFIRLGSISDTTGVCYSDYLLSDHLSEALRTKTPFGYFFYTRPKFGPTGQTKFILDNLALLPKAQLEFTIDGEQPGTSIQQTTDFFKEMYLTLSSKYDSQIYTRQSFWDANVLPDPLWATIKLYAARYNIALTSPWSDGKYVFRDWKTWKFWQYTESGINTDAQLYGFPGAPSGSAGLELDRYNGTLEEFRAEYHLSVPIDYATRIAALEQNMEKLTATVSDLSTTVNAAIGKLSDWASSYNK